MYGVKYLREFDPKDEEHKVRKHRLFEMPSGPSTFDCILARGVKAKESNVFTNLSTLSVYEVEIWCYRGGDTIPNYDSELDPNARKLVPVERRVDKSFSFGLCFDRMGMTRYDPACIVFNESGHHAEDEILSGSSAGG
ncbi:hypothetical protein K466DRAFT_603538 [Polyporus arcularius HHB13444]|uniref:Uncharacterized protein n=1 Tax=Polyporus arcularius HHB13444 TaxID=1314778 RepID=A0A5C3P9W5_9APHY|nr:hypothetical protein K466DRAFT_603538 [Polyporus arcularius HHB13444]